MQDMPPSSPGGYGAPPPQGYGPPPGYVQPGCPPHGNYPQQGYGPGFPPPKKPKQGMGSGMIVLIVFGCLFGSCVMCGAIRSVGKNDSSSATASRETDPAAEAAKLAAQQKAAEEAKAAKEKTAVETFPTKKSEIGASLAKAKTDADTNKWAQANAELSSVERALEDFRGTSVVDSKDFQDLESKASALRNRVAPQVEKLAREAAAAAAEAELLSNSVVVTSAQLFSDYQSNEVAADDKYKGKALLVTGTVASVDKGIFNDLVLMLATPNRFMSTMCSMKDSEKGTMAELRKGERVRVLCKGGGMTLGSPSLRNCVFR